MREFQSRKHCLEWLALNTRAGTCLDIQRFQVRLIRPALISLAEFLDKANQLLNELKPFRFIKMNHDLNIGIPCGFDDTKLEEYLRLVAHLGNRGFERNG